MKRLAIAALALALAGLLGAARADDKKGDDKKSDDKPNPTGTWKWSMEINGQTRDRTLKLKLDGDKLTGSMPGRNNTSTDIEDATFKDGQISFTVTRDRNGQKTVSKYTGKLDGDTIKGKIERTSNGDTTTTDWTAKRSTD
jgi:hypothetical protein